MGERIARVSLMSPEEALKRLAQPLDHVIATASPFAAILTCSDPRVCPDLIFKCNQGDLFEVRTAGHVLTREIEETLIFAFLNMDIHLIVVLGHENCLAVKAAKEKAYPDWNLTKLISGTEEDYSRACQKRLASIEPFKTAIAEGTLKIEAAHLSFTNQSVEWL
ncbi:MAG: hypothetical protein KDK44_00260 [Chlamydiia bacterium]|nr:hypothetical protein [Chlamydiia bacterium]MCP5510179.1 hypothetical protein [Chlamydiales bacterium]